MPFRMTSVQAVPMWRTTVFNSLLPSWILIADGLRVSWQRKSNYVTKLCSTFWTTFRVTANLQSVRYPMKFPRVNNGTAMQSHRPYWTGTKGGDDDFLGLIVAMDETWDRSYEPNLKRQSNEWKHPGSSRPKKVQPSHCDVHCGVWHRRGNTAPRCTRKADGKRCLQLQRSCSTTSGENDETWWHMTLSFFMTMQGVTPLLLSRTSWPLQWEILENQPYSPDISQCDYDLFAKVRRTGTTHEMKSVQ